MAVIQRIWAQERFKGFYRGYLACEFSSIELNATKTQRNSYTLLTDLCSYAPGSAVQWGSYEVAKGVLHSGVSAIEKQTHVSIPQKDHVVNALSGGVAALCAVTANNPIEVIRVRTQLLDTSRPGAQATLSGGYISLAKTILKKEGWKTFYTGLRIRICMAVPTAMVAMSGYETVKAMSLD